jgi:hypothetical protein
MAEVTVRVEYANGDFDYIKEPSLLEGAEIEKYVQDLLKTIGTTPVYPGDTVVEDVGLLQDILYANFKRHYKKIASFFSPAIRVEEMTPESRHEFFICTDPKEGQAIAGVSLCQKLLGHDLPTKHTKKASSGKKLTTSGNYRADIAAAIGLTFKGQTKWLDLPLSFLLDVLEQAGNLSEVESKDKTAMDINRMAANTVDVAAFAVNTEEFDLLRPQVTEFLNANNIPIPEEFWPIKS